MALEPIKIASKAVGALGLAVVVLDSNAMGVRKADTAAKNAVAKHSLRQQVGMSKMDYPSPFYNALRNETKKAFPQTFISVIGGIGGYFKGLYTGVSNNLPIVAFSALALIKGNEITRKVGMIGVGVSALWSYLKNGTALFENKKYLDK